MCQKSGYVNSWLCDENGDFKNIPTITFNFLETIGGIIPGMTITWSTVYEEWATQFRIIAYDGEETVFSRIVDNDDLKTVVEDDIQGYTRITLEIIKWSKPFRRARLENVVFGIQQVYTKSDLMSYSAVLFVDPLSAELPFFEITFELKNLDGAYNPDNPDSTGKYIMERQTVTVSYGYELENGVEWISGGVFYLSDWETPQNGITAMFKARDGLEFMSDIYTGPTEGTLYRIARAAFRQANLPLMEDGSERWEIHPSLERMYIPSPVDLQDSTIAEVLQYVANAACCVLYQDRNGKFHLTPLSVRMTDYTIDRFNSYQNSEMVLSKPLKAVDVNRGQYILSVAKKGETQPIANPLIPDSQAPAVAKWAAEYLANRRVLSGDFRADPRLDPLDIITNVNQFSTSRAVVTEVKLSYNGAFRGSYKARGVDNLFGEWIYSGELYSGEVQR